MISPVKIWRRQKDIRLALGKQGMILTWTYIVVPPGQFKEQAPYYVILAELADGKRIFGQLVDCDKDDVKIGKKVVTILRKVREGSGEDVISYGIKFKLL